MIKEFYDEKGINLIIEHNKSNVTFKTDDNNIEKEYNLNCCFNENTFKEIRDYLTSISCDIWKDFKPKIADSMSSDYTEYYDKKFDSNGYLSVYEGGIILIERPSNDCPYMYKFNKRRMESFIYDLNKYSQYD